VSVRNPAAPARRLARRAPLVASAVVAIGLLAGCAPSAASSTVDTSPSTSAGGAAMEGAPVDTAIAATCAGFSAFDSVVTDAKHRLDSGEISEEEYTLVLKTAYYGFNTLRGDTDQRGLAAEVDELLKSVGGSTAAADGALDPRNEDFARASDALGQACAANSSSVVVFAQGG
jgi:hypothetical protein